MNTDLLTPNDILSVALNRFGLHRQYRNLPYREGDIIHIDTPTGHTATIRVTSHRGSFLVRIAEAMIPYVTAAVEAMIPADSHATIRVTPGMRAGTIDVLVHNRILSGTYTFRFFEIEQPSFRDFLHDLAPALRKTRIFDADGYDQDGYYWQ